MMLRPEFRRAFMRQQRGRWWQWRRWSKAANARYHERRMDAAFTRVTWECVGQIGHTYRFVPEPKPARGGNLICGGEPAHVICTRCYRKAGLGISLSMREASRRFRTFTDGGPRIDWKPIVPDEHGQAMLDIMERKRRDVLNLGVPRFVIDSDRPEARSIEQAMQPVCQRAFAYFQDVATCTCQHCVEARRDA